MRKMRRNSAWVAVLLVVAGTPASAQIFQTVAPSTVDAKRVAKETLDRPAERGRKLARQRAEQEAKMAKLRANLARQQAPDSPCQADDRTICAPR